MKEDDYKRITYDITMAAASLLSRLNGDMTFCYVSGEGTYGSEKGPMMWTRVKGKTENDILKLPSKGAFMFRPGYIRPTKGLKNAYRMSTVMGTVYPFLRAIAPKHVCTLEELGLAMINVTQSGCEKHVLENVDIRKLGASQKV